MTFLDLFDQVVVTEFVRRNYEDIARSAGGGEDRQTSLIERILPTKTHNGRHVRLRFQDILGVGLAQFKAPGAAPALWTNKPNLREQFMELVDIDEMFRVDPVEMLRLKSPDPNVLKEAQFDLQEKSTNMAIRNEQRSKWMGWQALRGVLPVSYPNAGSLVIQYGIPGAHFPTFATAWTDIQNSDPVEDLWALGAVAIPASGIYLGHFHMTFATQRYMLRSTKLQAKLSSYGRDVMWPSENDVIQLLRDGSQITVSDDGYMVENSTGGKTLNKWINDGEILTTTRDYRYAGQPIGDIKDGWCLIGPDGGDGNQPVARQGMQSEWIYNRVNQSTLFRQVSARMPTLKSPEALAWGKAF